jgi:hypothetical protein
VTSKLELPLVFLEPMRNKGSRSRGASTVQYFAHFVQLLVIMVGPHINVNRLSE